MIIELMIVGGVIFWPTLFLVVGVVSWLFADDSNPVYQGHAAVASVIAVIFAAFVILFTDALDYVESVFPWMSSWWYAAVAVAYVVIGVSWSFYKWYRLLVSRRKIMEARYKSYEMLHGVVRPSAAEYKTLIVSWMVLWPVSVFWFAADWPRKLFSYLYDRLGSVYEKITDHVFGDLKGDHE